MSKKKGVFEKIKAIQQKIDLTPLVLKLIDGTAKAGKFNIFMFLLLLLIGFFGLLLPIIQGWMVIALSFTALGIKPLNKFIQKNKKKIESLGTIMFTITFTLLFINTLLWATGVGQSPVQNVVGMVTWGQEDLEKINDDAMSVIGLDYEKIQQSMSLVDYNEFTGWSLIGVD